MFKEIWHVWSIWNKIEKLFFLQISYTHDHHSIKEVGLTAGETFTQIQFVFHLYSSNVYRHYKIVREKTITFLYDMYNAQYRIIKRLYTCRFNHHGIQGNESYKSIWWSIRYIMKRTCNWITVDLFISVDSYFHWLAVREYCTFVDIQFCSFVKICIQDF